MMNLNCKEQHGILSVDELQEGEMYTINGEELTPLEVSKLALYFALNWEMIQSEKNAGHEV